MRDRERNALWAAYHDTRSVEALNALCEHYMPMLKKVARMVAHHINYTLEASEMMAPAFFGLRQAIERYDPTRAQFSTYAVTRIKGEILDDLRKFDTASRATRIKQRKINKAVAELGNELGREPIPNEISARMGIKPALLDIWDSEVLRSTLFCSVIRRTFDGTEFVDIPDKIPTAIEVLASRDGFNEKLRNLSKREKMIVQLYFERGFTFKQIGVQLGISESRVCQIYRKLIVVLRVRYGAAAA